MLQVGRHHSAGTGYLRMMAEHELLGIRIEVHLPVYPFRDRKTAEVMLEECQGHDQRVPAHVDSPR